MPRKRIAKPPRHHYGRGPLDTLIRNYCIENKITPKEFYKKSGRSFSTIDSAVVGTRAMSTHIAEYIGEALQLTPSEVMEMAILTHDLGHECRAIRKIMKLPVPFVYTDDPLAENCDKGIIFRK